MPPSYKRALCALLVALATIWLLLACAMRVQYVAYVRMLEREAPETLSEPLPEMFVTRTYYEIAKRRFEASGNWATVANDWK